MAETLKRVKKKEDETSPEKKGKKGTKFVDTKPTAKTLVHETKSFKDWLSLDEGRGRPRKDGSKGEDEDKNIVMQLHKVISLHGKKPVEFPSGEKAHIHPHEAHKALSKFFGMHPRDKRAWMAKAGAGLKSFRDSLKS